MVIYSQMTASPGTPKSFKAHPSTHGWLTGPKKQAIEKATQ